MDNRTIEERALTRADSIGKIEDARIPRALFTIFAQFAVGEGDTYKIEESTFPSQVIGISREPGPPSAFVSLTAWPDDHTVLFRLWPRKPEAEAWLVYAPREMVTVGYNASTYRGPQPQLWLRPGEITIDRAALEWTALALTVLRALKRS